MKGLPWVTEVADYSHLKELKGEQLKLQEMIVYQSHSSDPNYFVLYQNPKDFLKMLKNQKDKKHKQIVLSWLDHGLFSSGWGLFDGGLFHGTKLSELSGKDKENVITILKTAKQAFVENKFEPHYISINRRRKKWDKVESWNINSLLKYLGAEINANYVDNITLIKKSAKPFEKGMKKVVKKTIKNPILVNVLSKRMREKIK